MNHVYGNGEVPQEKVFKTFSNECYLPTFETKYKSEKVVIEVLVGYSDPTYSKVLDAQIISIRYKGYEVRDLVLTGWDEFELIGFVMGDGFVDLL